MRVLGSPKTWGDKVLAKIIVLQWARAYWSHPALGELADLALRGVPVLLVHGSDDDIMPAHQGDLARRSGLRLICEEAPVGRAAGARPAWHRAPGPLPERGRGEQPEPR